MEEYLKQYAEHMPAWLENYKSGYRIDMKDFWSSRMVDYPGAGGDLETIDVCIKTSCVHLFLYVDYDAYNERSVEKADCKKFFDGYHVIDTVDIPEHEIFKQGYHPIQKEIFSCIMKIFERDEGLTDEHGPKRFAIVFLCADGIASYESIFCRENIQAPFIAVIEDYGSGNNYDRFSRGGKLERIAISNNVFPKFIFLGEHNPTEIWAGYKKIDCGFILGGGMYIDGIKRLEKRYLFEKE